MIIPPFLKKGDKVGLIAPARKVSREEMTPAIETLKQWGFQPVEGRNLYKTCDQFSGTDEERISDINEFLADSSIRAILSARGGYGSIRIVDNIHWDLLQKDPKWICGYSDVTVFHSHIHQVLGMATIHSTMPINFHKDREATESLRNALLGQEIHYKFPSHDLNRPGQVSGKMVGGNLSLLYALMGSPSAMSCEGKILFIEDLDEYLYHIDRMMHGLKRSGMLKGLAGLVVGGMTDMKDNTVPFGRSAEEIVQSVVKEYDYPVYFGFPAGHIERNLSLVFGAEVKLEARENSCYLSIQNPKA